MNAAASTPASSDGLGSFDEYTRRCSTCGYIPADSREFVVGPCAPNFHEHGLIVEPDDDPIIGEVPPMTAADAMSAAVKKVGLDIWLDRNAVVSAAKDLRALSLAGVDPDSDVWHVTQERLFDAVDRVTPVVVFDIDGGDW